MNVIIIEDEDRAANRLAKLLVELDNSIVVKAQLESIEESIRYLTQNEGLDLIFSDIQLADGLCFDIFDEIQVNCPIIFTTAYDQYAIKAFETNGIGYLLKPIETVALEKALDKVSQLTSGNSKSKASEVDLYILAQMLQNQPKKYKERFMVRVGDKINSIPVEEIALFYSFQKSTYLLSKEGRKYIVEYPLDQLHDKLNPHLFYRINRKYILSIDVCQKMFAHTNSRLKIEISLLPDHDIIVARERVSDFKQWLDN